MSNPYNIMCLYNNYNKNNKNISFYSQSTNFLTPLEYTTNNFSSLSAIKKKLIL